MFVIGSVDFRERRKMSEQEGEKENKMMVKRLWALACDNEALLDSLV